MRTFVELCACLLLLAGGAHANAAAYSLLDLGPTSDQTAAINGQGQVVFVQGGSVQRFTDGVGVGAVASGYGRIALGGINNHGQVSFADASQHVVPILRTTDGIGPVVIGQTNILEDFYPGVSLTRPNLRGDVAYGNAGLVAYYSDLGGRGLSARDWHLNVGFATAINDAGTLLYGFASTGYPGGFYVWGKYEYATGANTYMHEPLLALNNRGDTAGYANNGAAIYLADGTVIPINRPGLAIALNDLGMAVGAAFHGMGPDIPFSYTQPWVFNASGVRDLNDLIDPTLGWTLWYASDINNAGQIAGTGFVNGQRHAFRLTPVNAVPEPASLILLSMGAVPLLLLQSKRRQAFPWRAPRKPPSAAWVRAHLPASPSVPGPASRSPAAT